MEELKIINQANPTLAVDLLKKEDSRERWEKQKKKLPRNVRYGLISTKTENLIKTLAEKNQLSSPEKIGGVAILTRNFMAGELSEDQLKKEIFQRFQLSNTVSIDFLVEFKQLIEAIKKIGIKAVKEDLVVLNFKELLEKFPEIRQQEIGVQLIFFPKENEGKAPWIENWIIDYRLRKTDQQKNTILNVSDYLYNSKNAQQLNPEEKEELSIILKAFEGNAITYYNKLFEQIDFEIIKLLEKNKKPKANFNITKFESKPYHDVDSKSAFKIKAVKKNNFKKKENEREDKRSNVLDLNNYI